MAASAVLELDVTPPVVTIGQATLRGSLLKIGYTTNEPAVQAVTIEGVGPATINPDWFVAHAAPTTGAIIVTARDQVGNEQTWRVEYTATPGAPTVIFGTPKATGQTRRPTTRTAGRPAATASGRPSAAAGMKPTIHLQP